MEQYIPKATVVAFIREKEKESRKNATTAHDNNNISVAALWSGKENLCHELLAFLDTIEVKDPYEQCIQYPSIKEGIKSHAETYSFNIESELFNQLTKEQQALWRKEIEQACISGGNAGFELARDIRYKENFEVTEVDLKILAGISLNSD